MRQSQLKNVGSVKTENSIERKAKKLFRPKYKITSYPPPSGTGCRDANEKYIQRLKKKNNFNKINEIQN
jgi:hypothetical protein